MKAILLRVAVVALALLAIPSAANATWMTGEYGYDAINQGKNQNSSTGVIIYAVYQNSGPTATTLGAELLNAGLPLTAINSTFTSAQLSMAATKYLYVYEVVNNQTTAMSSGTLRGLGLGADPSEVIAAGDTVTSKTGKTTTNAYTFGYTTSVAKNTSSSPSGNSSLIGSPTFTAANSGSDPWSYEGYEPPPGILFDTSSKGIAAATNNTFTSLMIIASNGAPGMATSSLNDASNSSNGSVPVPTPEPGTIALLGLTLPIFGWGYIRRLRQNRAVVAAAAQ